MGVHHGAQKGINTMDVNEVVRHDKARDSELSSHGSRIYAMDANEVVRPDKGRESELSLHGSFPSTKDA